MLNSVINLPSSHSRQRVIIRVAYWALQLLGWGFYFHAQMTGEVIFAGVTWHQATVVWGGMTVSGFALTHALRFIIKRNVWLMLTPRALLIRMFIAVTLMTSTLQVINIALSRMEYNTSIAPIYSAMYRALPHNGQMINQFITSLILILVWVGLYLGFAMQRHRYEAQVHRAELAQLLQAAELRLLKTQLNPHFLFNALNGVRALIGDEPTRAQEAVTQLARTLRYSLGSSDTELVSMSRELEMVNDYLALEEMRLGDRLNVIRDITNEAMQVRVPIMLVQTLVENAIKHGIAELKGGGTLHIEARIVNAMLIIRITNPYPIHPSDHPPGTGLKNSSERLRLLFNSRASLRLDLAHPGEAIAEVKLPV